jgi:hypothetical protein
MRVMVGSVASGLRSSLDECARQLWRKRRAEPNLIHERVLRWLTGRLEGQVVRPTKSRGGFFHAPSERKSPIRMGCLAGRAHWGRLAGSFQSAAGGELCGVHSAGQHSRRYLR